ncbi:lamin tail domain-containing protein [Brasilonema bromeliae]
MLKRGIEGDGFASKDVMKKLFSRMAVAIVALVLCFTTVVGLPTSADASVSPSPQSVVIKDIFSKGVVKQTESDEYVEITNQKPAIIDLSGWRLNSEDGRQNFYFPKGTLLTPGKSLRVYTNEIHPETGGFSFGIKRAVWNNKGSVGLLYDAQGNLVDSFSYGNKKTEITAVSKQPQTLQSTPPKSLTQNNKNS